MNIISNVIISNTISNIISNNYSSLSIFAAIDWISLLQTFGLAVSILIFLAWCCIRIAQWSAPRIDQLVLRMFKGLDIVEKFEDKIRELEERIDLLWEFQLRRAKVEAKEKGVGEINSPIKISEEAKLWMKELTNELKAFYRKLGRTLSETQLAEEIEKRFGKEIVEKVCLPHGLFQGACLLIAMEVARSTDKEVDKDNYE